MTIRLSAVQSLIEQLKKMPKNAEVKIWLPGSRIYLHDGGALFKDSSGVVLIEGNVEKGSALYPVEG